MFSSRDKGMCGELRLRQCRQLLRSFCCSRLGIVNFLGLLVLLRRAAQDLRGIVRDPDIDYWDRDESEDNHKRHEDPKVYPVHSRKNSELGEI